MCVTALQSGSSGNATLVSAGRTAVLVDCGISPSRLEDRLAPHGRRIQDLAAVLVTHEHSDHAGACGVLARKHGLPLYMTDGTAIQAAAHILRREEERARVKILPRSGVLAFKDGVAVDPGGPFDLKVEWIPVPHDAMEPVAFVVERQGVRVAVLTDLGHANAQVCKLFETLDLALLETNFDPARLRDGPYPRSLKRRIGSSLGHLSNGQAARLVRDHASPRLRGVLLGHLSAENNAPDLAREAMQRALEARGDLEVALHMTYRDRGAPSVEL